MNKCVKICTFIHDSGCRVPSQLDLEIHFEQGHWQHTSYEQQNAMLKSEKNY